MGSVVVITIITWFLEVHFHKTPQAIVKLIKRHVPKSAKRILDPAVGEGALLDALHCSQLNENLTLVDIDAKRLESIRAVYENLSLINSDFISWAVCEKPESFDLIVTNPPFSARVEKWIASNGKRMPIEMAFFKHCIELLQDGGTLLAIAPDTLVNSCRLRKDREWCFSQGAFTYAYQLPPRVFNNIEAAFYFLVFKKGESQGKLRVRNLEDNSEIQVSRQEISRSDFRLDHSYYYGKSNLKKIIPKEARPLSSLSEIYRGPIRANYKAPGLNHSDSFVGGGWLSYLRSPNDELCIGVKRVSRNAHLSFGLFPVSAVCNSTDCIIFIVSKAEMVFRILFYLRVILSNCNGGSFVLKGSGAKFIQVQALKSLPYFDLANLFPAEFFNYMQSYKCFDFKTCEAIERSVYTSLCWGSKVSLLDKPRYSQLGNDSIDTCISIEA